MKYFLVLIFSNFIVLISAQNSSATWNTLGKLTFKKEFDATLGFKIDKPVFGDE